MFKITHKDYSRECRTRSEAIDAAELCDGLAYVTHTDGVMWLERWQFMDGRCIGYSISQQQRLNDMRQHQRRDGTN